MEAQYGLFLGKLPFDAGVHSPVVGIVVDAEQGRGAVEGLDVDRYVGLLGYADVVVGRKQAGPFVSVVGYAKPVVAFVAFVVGGKCQVGAEHLANLHRDDEHGHEVGGKVQVHGLVDELELVGRLVALRHHEVVYPVVGQPCHIFVVEHIHQVEYVVAGRTQLRVAIRGGVLVQMGFIVLLLPVRGIPVVGVVGQLQGMFRRDAVAYRGVGDFDRY